MFELTPGRVPDSAEGCIAAASFPTHFFFTRFVREG